MVLAMNWQMIGYMMVIYIAAIQNISEEVKEAALIDGVTRGQMIRKIILPLIMPAITICLFMTLIVATISVTQLIITRRKEVEN